MPDCWKQTILWSTVNSDQRWKSVRARHPGAFVPWYLDKLFKSSSSVNECDSVTMPRSAMCWVSTTGKSRCLRAPWAHILDFSTLSKMIWEEITSCNLPSPSFLLNPCPPPTPACEIPSRTWRASQNSHWVPLERENTDLGWSGLHCRKICHYLLIHVGEEICDQQSLNKISSPYIPDFILQVTKGKRKKPPPWILCLW